MNPICPYCRTEVGESEGERKDCPGCGTPHHADCFAENGGCTVFGCVNAPSDEAKVTVSGTDLMGNVVTRQAPAPVAQPKTRVIFVLLGIFLGVFGVHNFYARYAKKGTIQLCATLLSCFYGAAISWVWGIIWVWAIIEVCTVSQDADGTQFV